MCKTIKESYDKHLTFDKLLNAYYRAIKNKGNRKDVIKFSMDLETNLCNLLNELKSEKYVPGIYNTFRIYEPKERIIKSLPFKDRIVQQWYIEEFIKPYFIPRFIKENCACLEHKGTLYAVNLCQKYMRKMKRENGNYYVLKCDIKKFFYSIDKNILYSIMNSYIKDSKLLNLTHIFIFDDEEGKGIPIGNYTSQFFANIYLDKLDKYIKEVLRIKYYVRFMDDFIILTNSKRESIYCLKRIKYYLNKNLKLELNNRTRYYPNKMGIDFCGYRIFEEYRLIRNKNKNKIRKSVKAWNSLFLQHKLNYKKMVLSFNSYLGYIKHANS